MIFFSVLSLCKRFTDRQTDVQTDGRTEFSSLDHVRIQLSNNTRRSQTSAKANTTRIWSSSFGLWIRKTSGYFCPKVSNKILMKIRSTFSQFLFQRYLSNCEQVSYLAMLKNPSKNPSSGSRRRWLSKFSQFFFVHG